MRPPLPRAVVAHVLYGVVVTWGESLLRFATSVSGQQSPAFLEEGILIALHDTATPGRRRLYGRYRHHGVGG